MHVAAASTHFSARDHSTVRPEYPISLRNLLDIIVIITLYDPNTRDCRVRPRLRYQFRQSKISSSVPEGENLVFLSSTLVPESRGDRRLEA